MELIITSLLVVWMYTESSWAHMWTERWGILGSAILLASIYKLRAAGIIRAGLAYGVIVAAATAFFQWHKLPSPEVSIMLRERAALHLILFAAFTLFYNSGLNFRIPLNISGWFMLLAIICSRSPRYEVLFMHNPSMASTFVVLATWGSPVSIVAPLLCRSWTGFIVWCAIMAVRQRRVLLALALSPVPGAFLFFTHRASIPDNGRFSTWGTLLEFFRAQDPWTILFGAGAGSTSVWLPVLNIAQTRTDTAQVFIWAHNDYLQVLFEYGATGLILFLAGIVWLFLQASEKNRPLIVGFCAAMLFNFPLHWALTAILGWELVKKEGAHLSMSPSEVWGI